MRVNSKIWHSTLKAFKAGKATLLHQGGSRSGKTYNILLWIIFYYCQNSQGKTISIFRNALTVCRKSVMKDFFDILKENNLYSVKLHNKTDCTYTLFGNVVEFCGADDPEKLKSVGRDLLYFCEANSINYNTWVQLAMRSKEFKIVDFNPNIPDTHWLVDLEKELDSELIISTYRDNVRFLSKMQITEIEKLQKNHTLWKVYGQGLRAVAMGLVFPNCQSIANLPADYDDRVFGLDYGETHDPVALIEVRIKGNNIYLKEHIYQTHMGLSEIINRTKQVASNTRIFGDHALLLNKELLKAGLHIKKAWKPAGSVAQGIRYLQDKNIHITEDSNNMWIEQRNYCYPEKDSGVYSNNPIDAFNHGWDAVRYAIMTGSRGSGGSGTA